MRSPSLPLPTASGGTPAGKLTARTQWQCERDQSSLRVCAVCVCAVCAALSVGVHGWRVDRTGPRRTQAR